MNATTLSSNQRLAILREEYRAAIASLTPKGASGESYSGQQIAYAKGVARRNALRRIDEAS